MKALTLTLIALGFTATVQAATETWEGNGTLFDQKGQAQGSYRLLVENTQQGNEIQNHVTVTLADGSVREENCQMTKREAGHWNMQCGNDRGGGSCLSEGLCISYVGNENGRGYATTIILDGPSEMRLLRTELQNGQALRFFSEKLHRRAVANTKN